MIRRADAHSVMMKLLVLALGLLTSSVHAAKCDIALDSGGTRPHRKTLGPGAILTVKTKMVQVGADPNGGTEFTPVDQIKAYAPDVPLLAKTSYALTPGDQVRVLEPMKSHHQVKVVRVELLPDGEKAVMYWTDVYYNTLVTEAGEALPAKPKPVRHKFPNKCQRDRVAQLWAEGQTPYGRPKAEVGQIVWMANHSRAMGRGSVGTLISYHNETSATVKNLAGHTVCVWNHDCVPLTPEEIAWFETK